MPVILKSAGCLSSSIGKWGPFPPGPAEFGFDDYLKFAGSGTHWHTQDRGRTMS